MEILQPPGWKRPKGYSNGIAASGRMVFVAGQIGWNADEEIESDDFAEQFRQALANIVAVLAEAVEGASEEDVPPAEVAEQVIATAEEAAPESELTLGDCTAWVADPGTVLDGERAEECAAMIAAAVGACEGLDCFGEGAGAVEEPAPATTAPLRC